MKHRSLPPDFPISSLPSPQSPRRPGRKVFLVALALISYASGWFHGTRGQSAKNGTTAGEEQSRAVAENTQEPVAASTQERFVPAHSTALSGRESQYPTGLSFLPHSTWIHRLDSLSSIELLGILRELGSDKHGGMEAAMRSLALARLAQIDPFRALGFARTLPDSERRAALKTALSIWTEKDPIAASRHLSENLDSLGYLSTEQRDAVASVARQWAMKDPMQAARWAASLPPEVRHDALIPALSALASTQPSQAIEWANSMSDSLDRSAVVETLVRERALSAPAETRRWIQQLPTVDDRVQAAKTLVQNWADQDAFSAASWIQTVGDSATHDAAVTALLESSHLRTSPEDSYQWIQTIQDPEVQASQLGILKARWSVLNPDSFAAQFPSP